MESLHLLAEAVRGAGADIAPTYQEYMQLAFAVANDCGEAGRADFHTLCSPSPKYDRQAADKLFGNALKSGRDGIHLAQPSTSPGSAAWKCSRPWVQLGQWYRGLSCLTHTRARARKQRRGRRGRIPRWQRPADTPAHLRPASPLAPPAGTHHACGTSRAQCDVLLLGAVTVLGASMGSHVRCSYGGKMISPCLQSFVVGLPVAGKGVLSLVRLLVEPIHDDIRRQVDKGMEAYRREKARYDALGKDRAKEEMPVPPPNRMFLISGNNTGTGILQNLMDSDGTGLICESEADTISTAIGSDYGTGATPCERPSTTTASPTTAAPTTNTAK